MVGWGGNVGPFGDVRTVCEVYVFKGFAFEGYY